jgi:hypothetical protein
MMGGAQNAEALQAAAVYTRRDNAPYLLSFCFQNETFRPS